MARWDPDIELDAATITGVLDDQFPELGASERGVARIGAGWDNAVWLVGDVNDPDPIAFRFTQRHFGVELALREMAVMPRLAELLPLPVTAATHIGAVTDEVPLPWFGYPLLPGDEAAVVELDAAAQLDAARELGSFLRALHSAEVLKVAQQTGAFGATGGARFRPEVAIAHARRGFAEVVERNFTFPDGFHDHVEELIAEIERHPASTRRVVSHGDLHIRHVLLAGPGRITGIIDWGDMDIGAPAFDFCAYWYLFDEPARQALLDAYGSDVCESTLAIARLAALNASVSVGASAGDVGRDDVAAGARRSIERILTPAIRF